MNNLVALFNKYKEMILYVFFGGCTTLVNIVCYYISAHYLLLNTSISTIVAWIISVAFAYITNKIWVFESKSTDSNTLIKEIVSFVSCRFATGVMDLVIMIVFVDVLLFNDLFIKIISNILVIVFNYIASKLYIFKN